MAKKKAVEKTPIEIDETGNVEFGVPDFYTGDEILDNIDKKIEKIKSKSKNKKGKKR